MIHYKVLLMQGEGKQRILSPIAWLKLKTPQSFEQQQIEDLFKLRRNSLGRFIYGQVRVAAENLCFCFLSVHKQ